MCDRQNTIPESMRIAVVNSSSGLAAYGGGFADVFQGEHEGHPVAIKTIRIHSKSNLRTVASVNISFCLYPEKSVFNAGFVGMLQRSRSLETFTTSEHPTIAWRKFWRPSIFHGV